MSGQQWFATILLAEIVIGFFAYVSLYKADIRDWIENVVIVHLAGLGLALLFGLIGIATGEWVIG